MSDAAAKYYAAGAVIRCKRDSRYLGAITPFRAHQERQKEDVRILTLEATLFLFLLLFFLWLLLSLLFSFISFGGIVVRILAVKFLAFGFRSQRLNLNRDRLNLNLLYVLYLLICRLSFKIWHLGLIVVCFTLLFVCFSLVVKGFLLRRFLFLKLWFVVLSFIFRDYVLELGSLVF